MLSIPTYGNTDHMQTRSYGILISRHSWLFMYTSLFTEECQLPRTDMQYVNIKCLRLVVFRIIFVTNTFAI